MFDNERKVDLLLPKLSDACVINATVEDNDISKTFRSGARFTGHVRGAKNVRSGTFIWPNGARYDREFFGYHRHGHGVQMWSDGSSYEGNFVNDKRQGQGRLQWSSGEIYVGQFHGDQKHGSGKYSWPDGSTYSGYVHRNLREGYGTFCDANNNVFQGLYKGDRRFGPGVLTYAKSGQQDVGLWLRDKLARLVVCLHSFSIHDHPEYGYISDVDGICITVPSRSSLLLEVSATENHLQDEENSNCNSVACNNIECTGVLDQESQVKSEGNDMIVKVLEDTCYSSMEANMNWNSAKEIIVAWNTSPLFVDMQLHMIQSRTLQRNVSFDVENLMSCRRKDYNESGLIERSSILLHRAVEQNQLSIVEELLDTAQAYVDVSDNTGITPLIVATIKRNLQMINCLLDHGADVNRLTDERMSALTVCFVFYYPVEMFRLNIAEHAFSSIKNQETQFIYHYKDPSTTSLVNKSAKSKKKSKEFLNGNDLLRKKPSLRAKIQQHRLEQHDKAFLFFEENEEEAVESYTAHAEKQKVVDQNEEISESAEEDNSSMPLPLAVEILRGEVAQEQVQSPLHVVEASDMEQNSTASIILDALVPHGSMYVADNNVLSVIVDETHASMHVNLGLSHKSAQGTICSPYDGFESEKTMLSLPITVQDEQMDRCAVNLSVLEMFSSAATEVQCSGTIEMLTLDKVRESQFDATIRLLLKRGADPCISVVPMQAIFFAVKAADIDMVQLLLQKGASVNSCLSDKQGGLSILHIAVALPCEESLELSRILLAQGANVNAEAFEVLSHKENASSREEVSHRRRKPLHIACARDDNYQLASAIVRLLLNEGAEINAVCNGMSPLAIAIASGNDCAVEELLLAGADPNQQLAPDVLSALCTIVNTKYEHRRTRSGRLALIDKLIKSGANVMKQLPIGSKMVLGTVVDYAHYIHGKDKRVAHVPYHALNPTEREIFNDRLGLQNHLADLVRGKLVQSIERISQRGGSDDSVHVTMAEAGLTQAATTSVRNNTRNIEQVMSPSKGKKDKKRGGKSNKPGRCGIDSAMFADDDKHLYTKDKILDSATKSSNTTQANSAVASKLATPDNSSKMKKKTGKKKLNNSKYEDVVKDIGCSTVATPFDTVSCQSNSDDFLERERSISSGGSLSVIPSTSSLQVKCCYECGRSAFVHLQPCARCKTVFFCSKTCRMKAWSVRHKDECQRLCELLHPKEQKQTKKGAVVKDQLVVKDIDDTGVKVMTLSPDGTVGLDQKLSRVANPSKSALKLPPLTEVAPETKSKKRVSLFGIGDKWSRPKLVDDSIFDAELPPITGKASSPQQPLASSPLSQQRGSGDGTDWTGWKDARQSVISLARYAGKAKDKTRRTTSLPNMRGSTAGGQTAEQLYRSKTYSWIPEHLRGKDVVISNYSLV